MTLQTMLAALSRTVITLADAFEPEVQLPDGCLPKGAETFLAAGNTGWALQAHGKHDASRPGSPCINALKLRRCSCWFIHPTTRHLAVVTLPFALAARDFKRLVPGAERDSCTGLRMRTNLAGDVVLREAGAGAEAGSVWSS